MEKHNTVHATFASGAKEAEIKDDVWQYDYGQALQINGLSLPPVVEVHYANKGQDMALPQTGVTEGGVTTAPIPNEILREKGVFTAYIFVTDGESGETCYTINGYVNKRPLVKDFNTPEEQEILHAAVGAVNAAAERAESAEVKSTEAASQAHEDAAQTSKDREAIKNMVDSVAGIDEQVKKVEECTRHSQEAATQAREAKEAAVAAKTSAEEAARKTAEDKAAVELAKTAVDNAQRAVSEDRTAVESVKQSVEQLGNAIPEATQTGVQAVNQAKQTAVNEITQTGNATKTSVEAAGTKAVENVANIKQTATNAVETAKTEAVQAIQTEGATQTANITTEAKKQLAAVQSAAQEIVTDREQIKTNKADIAGIKEEMNNFSSAIINSAMGETIIVEDSSDSKIRGLSLYGKSTQATTTGAQLLNPTLFDANKTVNGVTFETQNDGSILLSGTSTGVSTFYLGEYIDLLEDGKSYIYYSESPAGVLYIAYNDETANDYLNKVTVDKSRMVSIKPYIQFNLKNPVNVTKHIFPIFHEGTVVKPWEPYTDGKPSPSPDYPQEITNAGADGEIECIVSGKNLLIPEKYVYKKLFLKAGTTLTLQTKDGVESMGGNVLFTGVNGKDVWFSINKGKTYVTNKIHQDVIGYKNMLDGDIEYCLSIGELAPYESYKKQTLVLKTPNGLCGIPVSSGGNYIDSTGQQWLCDEIDLKRGKYVQRVEHLKFDGSEDEKWSIGSSHLKVPYCSIQLELHGRRQYDWTILCNRGIGRAWDTNNVCFINEFKHFTFYNSEVPPEVFENADNAKAWITKHPLEIVYEIADPVETDLPPEVIEAYKQLHTNYPVTTILNNAEAGMQVEYVADTKNYIDNKIAESVKNQMQNFTNLLSLMPMETQAAMIENDVNRILESEVTK